jgi:UDP-N-acetylmuramoyl-L-alanyl-D-glutamate--2,6-diaminopimelate ligase
MRWSAALQALRESPAGGTIVFEASGNGRGKDPVISGVFSDSRKILPGSIFCCIAGERYDGHEHAAAAEKAGAAALVCERPVKTNLPAVFVESTREVMGELASAVYGNPASKLFMAGVTGTNGKSTTTYVLRSILQAAGIKTGLLGSVVESDGAREKDAERTTPESCDIQRQLAAMVKNGCGACVMEASSHGLYLGRLSGCLFDAAVFTNLHPEHLDFHENMENYFQAKRLLFTKYSKGTRAVAANGDDLYGKRLLGELAGLPNVREFRMSDAADTRLSLEGTSFTLRAEGSAFPPLSLESPLVGNFNVANVLAAVAALRGNEKIGDDAIVRGVRDIPQVPGRLERHGIPNGACCVIDFAHTPAALRSVLSAAREFCFGRLISLFGHGGGRYPSNRPALGEAAADLADLVIVTMDNPRDEDPEAIAESIVQGIRGKGTRYRVILDRKEAVFTALSLMGPGDVLVLSGKGPEKFLTVKDEKIPYNDAETVEEWIARTLEPTWAASGPKPLSLTGDRLAGGR